MKCARRPTVSEYWPAGTFSKILDPQSVPFTFNLNGRNSSVRVGNAMNVTAEPIKNLVTKASESVRIERSTGFICKNAE